MPKKNKTEDKQSKEEKSNNQIEALQSQVAELQARDIENQKKLKMLYDVADKGRVFNYESQRANKKPFIVKLSKYAGGIIVGWRTVKDRLITHPVTGATVGEEQEYELMIQKDDKIEKITIKSYPAFSSARYDDRIEGQVINKTESFDGETTYTVKVGNKTIKLPAKFIN